VLSALEGLELVTPTVTPYIVPAAVVILIMLFAVQPLGTERIGRTFGPIMAFWFVAIAALGLWGIAQHPAVLAAVDPRYAVALTAFGNYLDSILPFGKLILTVLNGAVPLILISFLFAAIYKVLPDRNLEWRDVAVGAVVTGVLFTIGKSLISWYIGSSAVASSFGAAGALIVLLLWGLLFSADFSAWGRVHEDLCRASRQQARSGIAMTKSGVGCRLRELPEAPSASRILFEDGRSVARFSASSRLARHSRIGAVPAHR
jgi:K+ potassium transporter/Virulence factor BrkB